MRVVECLGNVSDAVTLRMITSSRADSRTQEQDLQRLGGIRRAQLEAVLSMTPIMMSANVLSAASILLLEVNIAQTGASVLLWTAVACCYSVVCLFKLSKIRRAGWRAVSSARATGKIVLSSILLAIMWAYPALMIMSVDSGLETTFISITTAGMITGGALALYPVPFAAVSYACILTVATLPAVFWGSRELVVPFLIAIVAFLAIVMLSIRRQAGLFFLELDAKISAENQLGIAKLILDSVSGEHRQVTWQTDKSARITSNHEAFRKVLDWPQNASVATLYDVLSCAGLEARDALGESALQGLMRGDCSALLVEPVFLFNSAGQTYKLTGRHTLDTAGLVVGYHGYIKDFTEQTNTAKKIVRLATRDHATGLLNYQEFTAQAGQRALRTGQPAQRMFLFIDADNLKAVNDTFGHAAGDCLILKIAEELQRYLPWESLIARKGGDEFVALFSVDDPSIAFRLVERLMNALRSTFDYGPNRISFSCSIGASFGDAQKPLELIELEADRALYDAKRSRRSGWRLYDDESGGEVTRSRGLITDLPIAIEDRLIEVFYQPILAGDGRTIVGAEALLRWSHPRFGTVSPLDVLAAARSTGLMNKLSLYVVRQACAEASLWPLGCFVSVNMCATDFQLPNFSDAIINLLEDVGVAPTRLWLEITEAEAIGSCTVTVSNMARLRDAGINIAIDDFGAGYSSLNLFASDAFDVVKIDRALVASCSDGSTSRLILEAVRRVAQATGCTIVAEGIETADEYQEMRAIGCQAFQGYLFGRAQPACIIREKIWESERRCA